MPTVNRFSLSIHEKCSNASSNEDSKQNVENEQENDIRRLSLSEITISPLTFHRLSQNICDCVIVLRKQRNAFINRLREEFLTKLENYDIFIEDLPTHTDLQFLKLSISDDTLLHYAELLKLRLPLKDAPVIKYKQKIRSNFFSKLKCIFTKQILKKSPYYEKASFVVPFRTKNAEKYNLNQYGDGIFNVASRSIVMIDILENTKYRIWDGRPTFPRERQGINHLLANKIFVAIFPLHRWIYLKKNSSRSEDAMNIKFLTENWANLASISYPQPLAEITKHFGAQIGFLFAFFGSLVYYLIFLAFAGLACYIYAKFVIPIPRSDKPFCNRPPSDILCENRRSVNHLCPATTFEDNLDHPLSPPYALIACVWARWFLNSWKQQQNILCYRWHLLGTETLDNRVPGTIRSEFAENMKYIRKKLEQITPRVLQKNRINLVFLGHRFPSLLMTSFLLICFSLLVIIVNTKLYTYDIDIFEYVFLVYIFSCCASWIFSYAAYWVTYYECPRTNEQFLDSFSLKLSHFEFVNNYFAPFYVGMLRIVPFTNQETTRTTLGRLTDVHIVVTAWLLFDSARMLISSYLFDILKQLLRFFGALKFPQRYYYNWDKEFHRPTIDPTHISLIYQRLTIQFGMVTLFACSSPIVPIVALIINAIMLRYNAKYFLVISRKMWARPVQSIGAWINILDVIAEFSIFTNSVLIAFSSQYIDRIAFRMLSSDHGNEDFVDFNLRKIYFRNSSSCYTFNDQYHPENVYYVKEAKKEVYYWFILAIRLAFILVFNYTVIFMNFLVARIIPHLPENIIDLMCAEDIMAKKYVDECYGKSAKSGVNIDNIEKVIESRC